MFVKILAIAGVGKKVHTHLYQNNEAYRETVNRGVNDVVDGVEFARRCAADWWMWRTTGVEDGGRNA